MTNILSDPYFLRLVISLNVNRKNDCESLKNQQGIEMTLKYNRGIIRHLLPAIEGVVLLLLIVVLIACKDKKAEATAPLPPPEVDVALPLKKTVTEWDEYTGRFEAIERVEIRARVTGYLLEAKFKDGQIVEKDELLFIIDPREFQATLDAALAELDSSNARLRRAEIEFDRSFRIYQKGAGAEIDVENWRSERDMAIAAAERAKARIERARLDLSFTKVTAPISGRVSRRMVDPGNLVRENNTLLTRIVSVDPIHFYFEASQRDLLKYIRLDREGKRPASYAHPNPIYIKLPDEDDFVHNGLMDFVDNVVDPGTGTVQGRALVPNPEAIIYPGLFGRARLIASGEYEAILVPEKAINTDQSRKYVYLVNPENKVQRAYIELGPVRENGFYIVRSGLEGNERVVVSGIQRIRRANQVVRPVEINLGHSN
jgi:RND family efflux transporter MFP subunit